MLTGRFNAIFYTISRGFITFYYSKNLINIINFYQTVHHLVKFCYQSAFLIHVKGACLILRNSEMNVSDQNNYSTIIVLKNYHYYC